MAPPVRRNWRTPARDVEIEGVPVREGQKIMLVMGAAKHDPDERGTTVDALVEGQNGGQLLFGRDVRACLDAPIPNMKGKALISTLADRSGPTSSPGAGSIPRQPHPWLNLIAGPSRRRLRRFMMKEGRPEIERRCPQCEH